jgi:hypothetical protein
MSPAQSEKFSNMHLRANGQRPKEHSIKQKVSHISSPDARILKLKEEKRNREARCSTRDLRERVQYDKLVLPMKESTSKRSKLQRRTREMQAKNY